MNDFRFQFKYFFFLSSFSSFKWTWNKLYENWLCKSIFWKAHPTQCFFSFSPTSSFPSPQSLFFFPHFIYGVEMGEKLKAQYEWMGCLLHNWKRSLINDFVHAGVRISSSYWEGGFCIISWFASILIPLECQTCQVVTNSHCLIWGTHSLLPIRIKMPPHVT